MKIDIKGIIEGVTNAVFVKEEVEKIAAERLAICRVCPFNSEVARTNGANIFRKDEHCLKCGCNLHLKTRALSAQCPLDPPAWVSLASDEESEKIMKALEDNNKNKQNDTQE